jgi:hypothetical protein
MLFSVTEPEQLSRSTDKVAFESSMAVLQNADFVWTTGTFNRKADARRRSPVRLPFALHRRKAVWRLICCARWQPA